MWREPCDLSIEVMVGGKARSIRNYFCARLGTSENNNVPEPVLYITGSSKTVNAFIATTGTINLLDEDMKSATITLDAATVPAWDRKSPDASQYREWTAVIISWAGFDPWPNYIETIAPEAETRWTRPCFGAGTRGHLLQGWCLGDGLAQVGLRNGWVWRRIHRTFASSLARRCLRII